MKVKRRNGRPRVSVPKPNWIFTQPTEFYLALVLFIGGAWLCFQIEIYFSTAAVNAEYPNGPGELWLGRFLYLVLFAFSVPKVVLVPLLNLRTYLRSGELTKGPTSLLFSLFPIRYRANLSRATYRALATAPAAPHGVDYDSCRVSPGVTGRTIRDESGKIVADTDLARHLINFDSSQPLFLVTFYLPDDASRSNGSTIDWYNAFVAALQSSLKMSSFPNAGVEHVRMVLHSREEISRLGPEAYWR